MTNTPDLFVCGVAVCGPTDLYSELTSISGAFKNAYRDLILSAVGTDNYTDTGKFILFNFLELIFRPGIPQKSLANHLCESGEKAFNAHAWTNGRPRAIYRVR